ncbi:polyprenol phosphomannose-dependent alpha 1,6 mannosyltransferase MptB [Amycolatopsis sp. FU40]|uniref:polyprenol phosphomannose-dependent alpha 1,6 mannosyltransferase MptB n=1 Tax=Amycolatopsis sp. FU40 TaxID=2914159 RepID=UPI001F1B8F5B|nr:polyprenol phosphomannose-dependent alpha 1,6 mannosyltransferase MptB [Amycolatopsis sp. FU40]UKD54605.1 polyprenol phosphomannose-dependent alpha 1,6 mannosyltransferase MptB [Amycolatopsis sp. FU40]
MSSQPVTLSRPVRFFSFASAASLRWTGFGGVLLLAVAVYAGAAGMPGVLPFAGGIAGAGLVVLAWALLGGRILAADLPDAGWLKRTLALWCGPLLVVPPLFSGDVFSYLAQGAVAAHGFDLNVVGPRQALGSASDIVGRVSVYWRETPSPYGPLFGAVERVIAQVSGGNPIVGVALHRLIEVAGLVLIAWAVPRLAAAAGASPRVALWLGVLNPLVLWHVVAGMHNDSLMLGLMLAGVAIALEAVGDRIRWWPLAGGVLLIALGAEVKVPALVALAAVGTAIARRRGRIGEFLLAGAAMVLVFAAVSAAVSLASGIGFSWVSALTTSGEVNSWMAPTNWFGFLVGGIGSLFGAHLTQTMIGVGKIIGYVLTAAGIVVVLQRQWTGRIDAVRSLGLMLSAVVVFGPVVQPWYLLWAVIPLAASLPAGRVRSVVITLVAVFSVVLPPVGGNFSGRVGLLVLAYVIGLAVVVAAFFALRKASAVD